MDDETAAPAVRERYLRFAWLEAETRSPRYADWARGIAADTELLRLLESFPRIKQQPNLVLTALRFNGVPLRPWAGVRDLVHERWPLIAVTIAGRATQTNEAGRLAVLLPAFARLPQPLAIVEVGASMGLCLQPSRWAYDYDGRLVGDPAAPRLGCALTGELPAMPQIAWSAGLDLNPLSPADPDDVAWLEALIWPVGDGEPDAERLGRLRAAVDLARTHGPRVRRGDLLTDTAALIDEARGHAPSVVVFHTAVLAYLTAADRERFANSMRAAIGVPLNSSSDAVAAPRPGVHWVSNEGLGVYPELHRRLVADGVRPGPADFLVALDEQPVALADAHGRWVHVL